MTLKSKNNINQLGLSTLRNIVEKLPNFCLGSMLNIIEHFVVVEVLQNKIRC